MRVLTVCANLLPAPFDYAAWSTRRLSRALQAQGTEPILFTGSFSRRLAPGRIKRVQTRGMDCLAVGMRGTASRDGLSNPSAAQAFADALQALRPDVVHINSVSGLGFDLVAAATRSAVPTVVTVRDASYFCQYGTMVPPGGHWCGTPRESESPCRECLRGRATQRQRNARELLAHANIVLSSSPYLATVLRHWGLEVSVDPDGCWPGPNPESKPPRAGSPHGIHVGIHGRGRCRSPVARPPRGTSLRLRVTPCSAQGGRGRASCAGRMAHPRPGEDSAVRD